MLKEYKKVWSHCRELYHQEREGSRPYDDEIYIYKGDLGGLFGGTEGGEINFNKETKLLSIGSGQGYEDYSFNRYISSPEQLLTILEALLED